MVESKEIYKEKYFEDFSNLIKNLKDNVSIDSQDLEKFYTNIANFDNLSLQDIITYMLYCFEIIEFSQKWKLKKLINYKYFLDNMENIYNEIFCLSNSTFNNKIIATTSFGDIIEKTINYDVENKIEEILNAYLNCISQKRQYLQSNDLVLLRGNLYCQIYNTLNENIEINNICNIFLVKITKVFDYQKYFKSANVFFQNTLDKKDLSYFELNNFLSFKTYNKCIINSIELKKIFYFLLEKYQYEFFDKEIFVYLIESFVQDIIKKKNLDIKLEIVFEDKDDNFDMIFLNYNNIDCNFANNLIIIKDVYSRINKISYSRCETVDDYIKLLKTKDDLILQRLDKNTSVINYQNVIEFISSLEFNKFLGKKDIVDFNTYFTRLVTDLNKKKNTDEELNKNEEYTDKPFTSNELFKQVYTNDEIKELLEQYPILKLEYEENGNYKNIAELIKEKINLNLKLKNNLSEKEKIEKELKTYEMIINYRDCNLYNLLNDYYSLLLIDSVDSNLIKEKEFVLKNVLPNLLKQKLLFCGSIPKEKLDEIFNDYINPCVKKISQNRVNNKKFECTKDFLNYEKSNSDNYFGICKLQEILESANK